MIAETNPNHLAMMTGAYGDASGIPGNKFALYAPLENEDSCQATGPVDETKPPSVTSGENANCPLAETVFEAIKRQGNPDGLLTAGIFGKPKLGRIFADGTGRPPVGTVLVRGRRRLLLRAGADQPGNRLRDRRQDRDGRGRPHDPGGRGPGGAPARLHVREPAPGR